MLRNQSVKLLGDGSLPCKSHKSRCVCPLTNPGKIAALPKSQFTSEHTVESIFSITPSRTEINPGDKGTWSTGNTYRDLNTVVLDDIMNLTHVRRPTLSIFYEKSKQHSYSEFPSSRWAEIKHGNDYLA